MKKINWADVAKEYNLTPAELEKQIFITACVMADMQIDRAENGEDTFTFSCTHKEYDLKMNVTRRKPT